MGHRGFVQYIGECGHSWEHDDNFIIYGDREERKKAGHCPVCQKKAAFLATTDTTNGYGLEYGDDAVHAPMKEVGFTDEWKKDHYDNKYAVKHLTYEPVGDRWKNANEWHE